MYKAIIGILKLPLRLMTSIFGNVSWTSPAWLSYCVNGLRHRPVIFVPILLLLIALCTAGVYQYRYWQSLPKAPVTYANASLKNVFADLGQYKGNFESIKPSPIVVKFSRVNRELLTLDKDTFDDSESATSSVASLALLEGNIDAGVSISPHVAGIWYWQDQNTLIFTPEKHWPAGQDYEIVMTDKIFANHVKLDSNQLSVKTEALRLTIDDFQFYQDPTNIMGKRLSATIKSNYPLSRSDLEANLSLSKRDQNATVNSVKSTQQNLSFELESKQHKTLFYVHSESLTLPEQSNYADIKIAKSMVSVVGGKALAEDISGQSIIPDIYALLKVKEVSTQIIFDPDKTPHQVIAIEFTDAISQIEISQKLTIYSLPQQDSSGKRLYWQNANDVPNTYLNEQSTLDYELSNQHLDSTTSHLLKIKADPQQQLYLKIESGLTSVNQFVQRRAYLELLTVPAYPQQLYFAEGGILMAKSATPALGIGSRGIDAMKVSVGKIEKSQLVHLITQTNGDLNSPTFQSWSFNEDNIAEFTSEFLPLVNQSTNRLNQSVFALDEYLDNDDMGLFVIKAQAYQKNLQRPVWGVEDKRLVLISDLGLIIKHNADGSAVVFVQSIKSGKPVAGAVVEFLAQNGKTLYRLDTNEDGAATLNITRNNDSEQRPTVVLVQKGRDSAFLPYNRYSNLIDYSRMDSGGVSANWGGEIKPQAYMFSDRGIYRPGEQIKLAAIVKNSDLSAVSSIPIEWVLRDPQYNIVESVKPTLVSDDNGLLELNIDTSRHYLTGRYSAALHLIDSDYAKNNSGTGRQIGNVSIEIQAFEPDTLSISSTFKTDGDAQPRALAWLNDDEIVNRVTLLNLFGTPASNNKVDASYRLEPSNFSFDKFEQYIFQSQAATKPTITSTGPVNLPSYQTDGLGVVTLPIDLSTVGVGTFALVLTATGYEQDSGRSVSTTSQVLYAKTHKLVGYQTAINPRFLKQDQVAQLKLVAVNQQLERTDYKHLKLRLAEYKTVSSLIKQENGSYLYQDQQQEREVSQRDFDIMPDGTQVNLNTQSLGDYVLTLADSENNTLLKLEYSVVGDGQRSSPLENGNQLVVSLNKADFVAGEEIEVSIDAPYVGSGLITIESDKVHASSWFTSNNTSSIQRITIPDDIEGSAYINVAYIRAMDSLEVHANPFSYALVPFSLDRTTRQIEMSINAPSVINPEKAHELELTLSKSAKYIIYAVDQGILQVANYQSPDPLAHFLKKRALGVNTYQMLDMLLPDIKLTSYAAGIGGDLMADEMMMRSRSLKADSVSLNPFERTVSNPAVYWSGIQQGQVGVNMLSIELPNDFAGQLQFFAIAVSENRIGKAETTSLVRGDFVIKTAAPSHMSPDDIVTSSLQITSQIEGIEGALSTELKIDVSEHLTLLSSTTINHKVVSVQQLNVPVSYRANDIMGNAELTVTATAKLPNGELKSSQRTFPISIRPSTNIKQFLSFGNLNTSTTIESALALRKELANQTLDISNSPLLFNCGINQWIEQSISPIINASSTQIIDHILSLVSLPKSQQTHVNKAYESAINELYSRQLPSGGFSFWHATGDKQPDIGVSAFGVMQIARSRGFAVSASVYDRALEFVKRVAQGSVQMVDLATEQSQRTRLQAADDLPMSELVSGNNINAIRAHAVYLLTRSGQITTNYIMDLIIALDAEDQRVAQSLSVNQTKIQDWRTSMSGVYIAASYRLMQQGQKATDLIEAYKWKLDKSSSLVSSALLIDNAQYLNILLSHFQDWLTNNGTEKNIAASPRFKKPFDAALGALYTRQFSTTSAAQTASVLYQYEQALSGTLRNKSSVDSWQVFAHANQSEALGYTVNTLDAEINVSQQHKSGLGNNHYATYHYPLSAKSLLLKRINSDAAGIFYQQYQRGFEETAKTDWDKLASSKGIEISRRFSAASDKPISSGVEQGKALTVTIRLRSTDGNYYEHIAITDLLPAGFVVEQNSLNRQTRYFPSPYLHHDIREDRTFIYTAAGPQISEFTYRVTPTILGQFVLPQISAQHQYKFDVYANTKLEKIEVVKHKQVNIN